MPHPSPTAAVLLAATLSFCGLAAQAQPHSETDPHLQLRGAAQLRASYLEEGGAQRYGLGLHRFRLTLDARLPHRLALTAQAELAGTSVSPVDLFLSYRLTDRLSVRAGRFAVAQPAAAVLTSSTQIDVTARTVAARDWAARTIGSDGRDFGVEARYRSPALDARLAYHNGDGSWSRVRGNVREDAALGDVTRGGETRGLAVSAAASVTPPAVPGLDFGGYVSRNASRNPNTALDEQGRALTATAAHLYWGRRPGSQPVRLKADVLAVRYDAVATPAGAYQQTRWGASLLGALRPVAWAEAFARGEIFEADPPGGPDRATFVTAGASVSPSARAGRGFERVRLTAAWTRRLERDAAAAATSAVLQLQVLF